MKILVCGGRDFGNYSAIAEALNMLGGVTLVIHGDAVGADKLGREWAVRHDIHHAAVPALWSNFGKAAGHRRNAAMLALQPALVVAFPGGRGTADMVKKARDGGFEVWQPYGGGE